jgi:hypothetical protein
MKMRYHAHSFLFYNEDAGIGVLTKEKIELIFKYTIIGHNEQSY